MYKRDPGFPLSPKMNRHHVASHQNSVWREKMTCVCVCVFLNSHTRLEKFTTIGDTFLCNEGKPNE